MANKGQKRGLINGYKRLSGEGEDGAMTAPAIVNEVGAVKAFDSLL